MRALPVFLLVFGLLVAVLPAALAEEIPLLDGGTVEGKILEVKEDQIKIEGTAKDGGTFVMTLGADHVDPHWWYTQRDAALGKDARARLELATWAVEHGLFRQAKSQFEMARKLDPKLAREFMKDVVPPMRGGIAAALVHSAKDAMEDGKLKAATKMLHAVLVRFGDTAAAADARNLQPTLQHRVDRKLRDLAYWKKFDDDEKARQQSAERRSVTDPIVELIRQGQNIMMHMPPMAAQANAADSMKQAGIEFGKALERIDRAEKEHAGDKELMERLAHLRDEATADLVQSHVTAGDVYTYTGDYENALQQAQQLGGIPTGAADAAALRRRVQETQEWAEDGIISSARWTDRR